MANSSAMRRALSGLQAENSGPDGTRAQPVRPQGSATTALEADWRHLVGQILTLSGGDGVAVAVLAGGELRCRASRGLAPPQGTPIDARSGLTAACLNTAVLLRCDDTESDLRVNREVCRGLGIRSLICVPVSVGREIVGLFEIFSRRPNAFLTLDFDLLRALAEEVGSCLAAEEALARTALGGPAALGAAGYLARDSGPRPADPFFAKLGRAALGTLLLAVGLFLLLRAISGLRPVTTAVVAPPPALAADPAAVETAPTTRLQPARPRALQRGRSSAAALHATTPAVPQPPAASAGSAPLAHALLLQPPPRAVIDAATPAGNPLRQLVSSVAAPEPILALPHPVLVHRVDPLYPALARQNGIEGEVVLEANVDEDGRVKKVRVVSGNSLLAAAAERAVRQWRYQPYRLHGKAVAVPISLTLEFKLQD